MVHSIRSSKQSSHTVIQRPPSDPTLSLANSSSRFPTQWNLSSLSSPSINPPTAHVMEIPLTRPDLRTPRSRSRGITSLAWVPVSDAKNKVQGVSVINPGKEEYCAKNANEGRTLRKRQITGKVTYYVHPRFLQGRQWLLQTFGFARSTHSSATSSIHK